MWRTQKCFRVDFGGMSLGAVAKVFSNALQYMVYYAEKFFAGVAEWQTQRT